MGISNLTGCPKKFLCLLCIWVYKYAYTYVTIYVIIEVVAIIAVSPTKNDGSFCKIFTYYYYYLTSEPASIIYLIYKEIRYNRGRNCHFSGVNKKMNI